MNGGSTIHCGCGQQFPLLPNMGLYRPMRVKVLCPWCEQVHRFTVSRSQFRIWEAGLDGWASDFFEVLAGFRLDVAIANDRVCELLAGDQ